ncbi:MAG TPA: TonB family protein [Terriglobia bacterium]|nr:TonB family protein [Terriglobia bacterium]
MSVETILDLKFSEDEKPQTSQLDLFVSNEPIEVDLFLNAGPEQELAIWRRRAVFLTSVFLHIFLIILIVSAPDLLRRGKLMMGIPVAVRPEKQITTLFLPPDLLKALRNPPPEARPSDKNRRAQGPSPTIDPNGLRMPYSRGNTPEPEVSRGATPSPPPEAAPTPPPGGPPTPPAPKPEHEKNSELRLDDVPQESGGAGRFHAPSLTPGQAIQQSLQAAARGGYHPESGSGGGGDSNLEFNNLHPNFSTEAPTILSDTRGVDFGPYLARIVYIVRRNWLAVIPESARLGEKGRTGIVFQILKDGSVPQLRLVASSGSDPLDRAALAGIHASIPFPPLPQEFTGNDLVLQFIFLYNIVPQ